MTMISVHPSDPHLQLRKLYISLCEDQEHFDEFKHLLGLYDVSRGDGEFEPAEACEIREHLNERIGAWLEQPFAGLSPQQVLLWRAILIEHRFNVSLSPWKESNFY